MLGVLVELAKAGGEIARQHFSTLAERDIVEKAARDYVSHVDRAVEDALVRRIRARFPEHRVLGEEEARDAAGEQEPLWIIDPIDGTTNFIRGIPMFAVSIAFRERGELRYGCIYDPCRDECFTGEAGSGVWVNGRRSYTSGRKVLDRALLASALPFRFPEVMDDCVRVFDGMQRACDDHRRGGSAALDLAWTAVGRLDGYYELGIYPWDTAAGEVLVRCGGGVATDYRGQSGGILGRRSIVAAATPELHAQLLERVAPLRPWLDRAPFAAVP
ncbi:MAG: hypothetical protein RLZZ127_19 [Planctomycetota bacterium]|jgi:myo-inositol-1(or 4)-monophosphatase